MVLEKIRVYIISKTSIKKASIENDNFINDDKFEKITKNKEFKEKASELLTFIENKTNTLDNSNPTIIQKIYNDSLYRSDYVFIVNKNTYNIFKIIENYYGQNDINYNTVIEKDFNNFVTYLNEAINNLDENFKTKQNDMIKDEIDKKNRNYTNLIEHINETKTNLKKIDNTYKELINRLNINNKDILKDFNNLKTDISKDIGKATTKINDIKEKENPAFSKEITNKVNEELRL
jgi:hypothetical protein